MRKIFVTGIGTDIGKTIISSMLVEALKADYWKPIQAGFKDGTDTELVKNLISNSVSKFFNETYLLKESCSPHAAAEIDEIKIKLEDFKLPISINSVLIIEGAGGLLVPINDESYVIDMIPVFGCEVLIVSKNYLGSINHTLLTLEELKRRNCKIAGIVFNGEPNKSTESIILKKYSFPFVAHIKQEKYFTKELIKEYSSLFKTI